MAWDNTAVAEAEAESVAREVTEERGVAEGGRGAAGMDEETKTVEAMEEEAGEGKEEGIVRGGGGGDTAVIRAGTAEAEEGEGR